MHGFIRKIVFLLLFPILLHAQKRDIIFERLSLQDGLTQSTIRCIFQGSRGFIWIGTQYGLNRYDGYHFKVYKHDPNDSTSVSSSIIYSICEDQSEVLWIGSCGGINELDPDAQGTTFVIRFSLGKTHLNDEEIVEISQMSSIDEKVEFELEKPEFEEIT